MLKPLRQKILDSVDNGITKAQDDYIKGSRSLLCWGPEYLITVNIFQSLLGAWVTTRPSKLAASLLQSTFISGASHFSDSGPKLLDLPAIEDSLSLEQKASEVEEYRRKIRGRKPASVSGRSRCDLVLSHANKDGPRAVIEVKRCAEQCSSDLKRLTRLVSQGQGLEFSITVSCMFKRVKNNGENVEDTLRNDVKNLHQKIKGSIKESNLGVRLEPSLSRIERVAIPVNGKTESKEDWVWCPVIFMIYRKRNHQ